MDTDTIEELTKEVYKDNEDKDLIDILKKKNFRFMKENLSENYLSILIISKYKSPKYQKLILTNSNIINKHPKEDRQKIERFLIAREYGYYLTQNSNNFNHFCKIGKTDENIFLDNFAESLLMPLDKVNEIASNNKNLTEYELSLLFEEIFQLPYEHSTKRYFELINNNFIENPIELIKK